jgi:hypothetical protein
MMHLFAGAGEMRARCRAIDRAATPLVPLEEWPASLCTSAALVHAHVFPAILLSYAPVRDEAGGVGGIFITPFDVSAQVAGRAAAAEREGLRCLLGLLAGVLDYSRVEARADPEKLHQILLNLLGNAVRFTDGRSGDLTAESMPGVGSAFTRTLPGGAPSGAPPPGLGP